MTRYRLAEGISFDGEMEANTHLAGDRVRTHAGFSVKGEEVWLPLTLLTEVKPPLPDEPPVGSFVNAGPAVLHRRDDAGIDWYDLADRCWLTWAQVCDLGTPVRLIPAPEPVDLPWEHTDRERCTVNLEESPRHWAVCRVGVGNEAVDLTPEAAREMARALNTAVDKAEAEATS